MFSGKGNLVHYCSQEKEGALLYLGEGKRCSIVFRRRDLVRYCSQEKEICVLLFSGEVNMCSIVFRRREHVHYCYQSRKLVLYCFRRSNLVLYCSQEKETGALHTTVLKKKETGALLLMFSGEGDWCSTVLWRRAMGLNLSVLSVLSI